VLSRSRVWLWRSRLPPGRIFLILVMTMLTSAVIDLIMRSGNVGDGIIRCDTFVVVVMLVMTGIDIMDAAIIDDDVVVCINVNAALVRVVMRIHTASMPLLLLLKIRHRVVAITVTIGRSRNLRPIMRVMLPGSVMRI
jgi:hypothetical protein